MFSHVRFERVQVSDRNGFPLLSIIIPKAIFELEAEIKCKYKTNHYGPNHFSISSSERTFSGLSSRFY